MKKKIIIFGIGKIADVIYYYASSECGFEVAAFCVDNEYLKEDTFNALPVYSFENIEKKFAPDNYDMFIAIGYHELNKLRQTKCSEAIAKGYHLVSIISPLCHVPHNVTVGWNCFIMPPSIIHPCVQVKNNVFICSLMVLKSESTKSDLI